MEIIKVIPGGGVEVPGNQDEGKGQIAPSFQKVGARAMHKGEGEERKGEGRMCQETLKLLIQKERQKKEEEKKKKSADCEIDGPMEQAWGLIQGEIGGKSWGLVTPQSNRDEKEELEVDDGPWWEYDECLPEGGRNLRVIPCRTDTSYISLLSGDRIGGIANSHGVLKAGERER